jgi:2-oxoisovalerate dehydrogenase E2 component (dihydrolipoyl transacylase)
VSPRVTALQHFLLPDLGEGLTEAEIVAWHVAVGDEVALNQVLVEVETEKAVVELPSPYAGTVVEVLAASGESVPVGTAIIAIATAGPQGDAADEKVPTLVGYGPSEAQPSRRRRKRRSHGALPGAAPPRGARPLAAPPVRFMARQNGVDLARVEGHGPGGVITREDLAAHLAGTPQPAPPGEGRETRTPVRGVQKHMAEAMVRSVATAPQACVFLTLDVTPTAQLVGRLRENRHFDGLRVTPLAIVAKAVLLALREHAALNSSWDDATAEVVTKHYVNLGIAVAGPSGLVVPNIKDAQELTLRDLTRALADLTERARAGHCTPADLSGGTITVTNVGVFGVDAGVPILNPGEAAILAVGAIAPRPWIFENEVAPREVMTLSLSFDHRLVDGRAASQFLAAVGELLSDPTNLIALG